MKKGISSVVATVLIVLITVASVSILWASIQPLMSNAAFVENPHLHFNIDKSESFTLYDSESGYLRVRITRGSDNDNPMVIALKFVIDIEGTTVSRKTYNVMPPNHALVYYFLVGFDVDIRSVKIVPVYLIDGEEREGRVFDIENRIPLHPGELKDKVGNVPIVHAPENPVTDGLVLYYSFDEQYGSETHVADESGAGHTGELHGDVELVEHNGRQFAEFDGLADYISLRDGQGLADATGDDKTISFWARFDCPIDVSNLNQAPFGSYENYYVSFVDPCSDVLETKMRINYDLAPADPRSYASEGIWSDISGWEFFAIVLNEDDGEIRIYRNGELVDSQSGLAIGVSASNPHFYVGTVATTPTGGPDTTSYFKGSLDELRIYNRSLVTQEIQDLYGFVS